MKKFPSVPLFFDSILFCPFKPSPFSFNLFLRNTTAFFNRSNAVFLKGFSSHISSTVYYNNMRFEYHFYQQKQYDSVCSTTMHRPHFYSGISNHDPTGQKSSFAASDYVLTGQNETFVLPVSKQAQQNESFASPVHEQVWQHESFVLPVYERMRQKVHFASSVYDLTWQNEIFASSDDDPVNQYVNRNSSHEREALFGPVFIHFIIQ